MTWPATFINFLALGGLGTEIMELHFASVWEAVSDLVPHRPALICGNTTRTWREYDNRAARIAALLDAHGIGHDSKVGIYLHNSNEYLEAQYGIFKARGVPVNVNYRYKADELVYLLDNADAEALFFQACYAARIWEIRKQLPKVKLYVQVDDGTESLLADAVDYERSIRDHAPMERIERRSDETYMLYTGGTTGMPKGVMYQHGQFISVMMGAVASLGLEVPSRVEHIPAGIEAMPAAEGLPVSLTACPLMHGTGMWLGSIVPLLTGGTVVTVSKLGLDPHLIWSEVERNRCTSVTSVGDAFAKPMLDALDDAARRGNPYDLSSLDRIVSSGVMWTPGASGGTSNLKSLTKGWYSFAAIHGVFPGTGIELANLIKRKLADRTRPVRGSINSRVVHKHDLPIPSVADIHLDGVRADFESASNRRESILRCRPRRAPVSNQQDFVVCRRRTFRYKRCGSEKQHNRCSPSRKTMVHSHLEKAESLILEAFRAPRGQAFGAVSSHSNTRSAGVADTCGLIAPALLAVSDLSDPGYCQARTSRSMLHP